VKLLALILSAPETIVPVHVFTRLRAVSDRKKSQR